MGAFFQSSQETGSWPQTTLASCSFATLLNFLTDSAASEDEATSPGKHLSHQ